MAGCENRQGDAGAVAARADSAALAKAIPSIAATRPAIMTVQPFQLGGRCNTEELSGGPWGASSKGDSSRLLKVSGWGVDDKRKMAPKAVYLRVQDNAANEYYVAAQLVPRPDVAAYYKEEYFSQSGYQVTVDIRSLPASTYQVMIIMDVGGITILCSSGATLVVSGETK